MRLHQLRTADFSQGQRLHTKDHLIAWPRPQKPTWMEQETYERMPESITMREMEGKITQPGVRTESLVVTTTLTDAKTYTKEDVAELYHKRWLAETDIAAIKITMGIDV